VLIVDVPSGASTRLTDRTMPTPPRPEACVFSPDGRRIAFMRSVAGQGTKLGGAAAKVHNQIFVVDMPE
jgi:Tol biopolymer transport system component